MGSKELEGQQQTPDESNSLEPTPAKPASKAAPNSSTSADIGRGVVDEGNDDDEDEDEDNAAEDGVTNGATGTAEKKKKKRKPRKKKSAAAKANGATNGDLKQSNPPRVLMSTLFPSEYPKGELVPYGEADGKVGDDNLSRTTDEEKRYNSNLWDDDFLSDYRQAAEIHRQVRQYAQRELIKPGASLTTIAEGIEDGVRALSGHQGLEAGDGFKASMGFPTGLCLNNVAAHWTPNPRQKEVFLDKSDVLKVDFGVQVNGRIVDSAFTTTFDPTYENLLASVKDATNTGIKHAAIDARMKDIGAAIQEVMESYEVEVGGKTIPVKAVRNITGHNILRYQIHGGKEIPFVKNNSRAKMEEGEIFAIETFGSTGKGYMHDDVGVYGYGRNADASAANLRVASAKPLLKTIDNNFGSIVFCRRYLERIGCKDYLLGMKHLIDQGVVTSYAPLVDVKGSMVAQFEHTILLHSGGKEVISRGDDY